MRQPGRTAGKTGERVRRLVCRPDRTLKRLLLVSAGDVTDQQPTLTVRGSTLLSDAFAIMDDNDIRAITVVDDRGKPLGFVKRREARNASGTCADILHPFRMTGKAEDNLRVVLSRLYESNTSWMPIVDEEGRYNGEIHRIILPSISAPAVRAGR